MSDEFKNTVAYLKSEIKEAAANIRAAEKPKPLGWSRDCRALHLIYGMVRGKSWGQIENNHPDGDPVTWLGYFITRRWAMMTAEGHCPEVPPALTPYVERVAQ